MLWTPALKASSGAFAGTFRGAKSKIQTATATHGSSYQVPCPTCDFDGDNHGGVFPSNPHTSHTSHAWTTAFAPPGAAFSTSETSSKVTKTCWVGYEHMAMNHGMLPKHNSIFTLRDALINLQPWQSKSENQTGSQQTLLSANLTISHLTWDFSKNIQSVDGLVLNNSKSNTCSVFQTPQL